MKASQKREVEIDEFCGEGYIEEILKNPPAMTAHRFMTITCSTHLCAMRPLSLVRHSKQQHPRYAQDLKTHRLLEASLTATTDTVVGKDVEDDLRPLAVGHHEPIAQTVLGRVLQTSALVFVVLVAVDAGVAHGAADVLDVDLLGIVQIVPALGGGEVLHPGGRGGPPRRGRSGCRGQHRQREGKCGGRGGRYRRSAPGGKLCVGHCRSFLMNNIYFRQRFPKDEVGDESTRYLRWTV